MPDAEALLQRLLTDPEFRASYRRDPAAAARAAGFGDPGLPAGRPLETLELRESRQSLLGALGAAAVEGLALVELSEHVVPQLGDLLPHVEEAQAATRPSGGDGLLDNEHVVFDAAGIADLRAGQIDPRIVAVLETVSRDHDIVVSSMRSDHPQLTAGGSVSNHFHGRAVDIAAVDGKPVDASNEAARRLAVALSRLDPAMRPNEIGSPWALAGPAYFTDADHQDHVHVGFDEPANGNWKPPVEAPDGEDPDEPTSGEDVDVEDADDGDDADDDDDEDDEDDQDDEDDEDDEDPDGRASVDDDDDEPDEDEPDEDEPDEDEPDEDEPDEDEPDEDEPDGEESGDSDADEDPDSHDDDSDGDDSDGDDSDADEDPDSHGDDGDGDDSDGDDSDGDDDSAAAAADAAGYPGDDAESAHIAAWMGDAARRRGLPRELPVMAALVESGMTNADHGDADSLGFFQMRTSVWDSGPYAGYARRPELQLRWFLDAAERVGRERRRRGLPMDARHYGEWIADVERPAAQYRGRYQLRLEEARELLREANAFTEGDTVGLDAGRHALTALVAAERQLGARSRFDGSGLARWAYGQAGIELPRAAADQINAPAGRRVARDELLPGDLVFFRNAAGVHDVGISLGGHRFIAAPRTGAAVEVASLRDASYANAFAGARRFDEAVRHPARDSRARVLPVARA